MECHCCGRQAGFNRAVVDVQSKDELGGLCVECERDAFGRTLDVASWDDTDDCVLCPRDGYFALPTWDPERVRENGRIINKVDWELSTETPMLCDEHLTVLLDAPEPQAVGRRTRRQR